jgi:hypothetical protein
MKRRRRHGPDGVGNYLPRQLAKLGRTTSLTARDSICAFYLMKGKVESPGKPIRSIPRLATRRCFGAHHRCRSAA